MPEVSGMSMLDLPPIQRQLRHPGRVHGLREDGPAGFGGGQRRDHVERLLRAKLQRQGFVVPSQGSVHVAQGFEGRLVLRTA